MRFAGMLPEFLTDLRQQRLRTALTVTGIAWGTVAVVVLLAFGVGLERQTLKRFHGLGERIVVLFGGLTTKAYEGYGERRAINLRESDVGLLEREVPGIAEISPEYRSQALPVHTERNTANPSITGVYPVYEDLRNVIPAAGGRFIDEEDLAQRRRVAVLGDKLKDLLFGSADAVGRTVYVGQTPFTVIGVMIQKQQNSSYGGRDQDRIFIPASTHVALFGNRHLSNIVYRTVDPRATKGIETQVREVLARRYTFDATDHDALTFWDTAAWEKQFSYLFLGFNIFFAIVGTFTLTVGGIGVANIMYIVVRERTREIGIRRSIGARRTDILLQFLSETFLIVALGAIVGMGASLGIVELLSLVPMQEFVGTPTISPIVMAVTLSLLAGIAFLAGLFPARRAAGLDPVECLRY